MRLGNFGQVCFHRRSRLMVKIMTFPTMDQLYSLQSLWLVAQLNWFIFLIFICRCRCRWLTKNYKYEEQRSSCWAINYDHCDLWTKSDNVINCSKFQNFHCLLITLIKCLKGDKFIGSPIGDVFQCLCHCLLTRSLFRLFWTAPKEGTNLENRLEASLGTSNRKEK